MQALAHFHAVILVTIWVTLNKSVESTGVLLLDNCSSAIAPALPYYRTSCTYALSYYRPPWTYAKPALPPSMAFAVGSTDFFKVTTQSIFTKDTAC